MRVFQNEILQPPLRGMEEWVITPLNGVDMNLKMPLLGCFIFIKVLLPAQAEEFLYDPYEQNPTFEGVSEFDERPIVVIDTGIDFKHPLLKNRLYNNKFEIADNGIDDDNNGFVDDTIGWDFGENNNNPYDYIEPKEALIPITENRRVNWRGILNFITKILISPDAKGHGTHVSGIIAQASPQARILPIRIDFKKNDISQQIHDAIAYAISLNARVINLSLGGKMEGQSELVDETRNKISKLIETAHETLFVIASGNNNLDLRESNIFPGGLDLENVLTVGAIDTTENQINTMASFSNWGEGIVEVYAPGVNINSSWPGGVMKELSGTSMATPYVAALAYELSLEWPLITGAELRERVMELGYESIIVKEEVEEETIIIE